jgi:putative YjhG/YagF family dehydratase
MVVHAAFGGSTNLLLHVPAIAHAAGLRRPTVEDWTEINRRVPRLVDALPNGPVGHPTVRVFCAGGVPEVMLHLRELGLLDLNVLTITGEPLEKTLDWWATSERRKRLRDVLTDQDGVNPCDVIMSPKRAQERGLTSTVCFPRGNLAPEGSVIKSTAIDPAVLDADGVYRKTGPARVFYSEREAVAAIKGQTDKPICAGDVLVLCGRGPAGSGMEETYQITSALKYLSWGRDVAVLTDARFSGVSTGACIGHVSPEALAGGPIGKLRDGDIIRIVIDRHKLTGTVDLVGISLGATGSASAACQQEFEADTGTASGTRQGFNADEAARELARRPTPPQLAADPRLPADSRLWAALQSASGGTWGGCVYDVDRIIELLAAGEIAMSDK